jgi:hypothetical protein
LIKFPRTPSTTRTHGVYQRAKKVEINLFNTSLL